MPGGDRTGPMGSGRMTGRRLGWCSGAGPGGRFAGSPSRFGGFGFGRGRGWRHCYHATGLPGRAGAGQGGWWAAPAYPPSNAQEELDSLREYTLGLEEELKAIKARMAEMEKDEKTQ